MSKHKITRDKNLKERWPDMVRMRTPDGQIVEVPRVLIGNDAVKKVVEHTVKRRRVNR